MRARTRGANETDRQQRYSRARTRARQSASARRTSQRPNDEIRAVGDSARSFSWMIPVACLKSRIPGTLFVGDATALSATAPLRARPRERRDRDARVTPSLPPPSLTPPRDDATRPSASETFPGSRRNPSPRRARSSSRPVAPHLRRFRFRRSTSVARVCAFARPATSPRVRVSPPPSAPIPRVSARTRRRDRRVRACARASHLRLFVRAEFLQHHHAPSGLVQIRLGSIVRLARFFERHSSSRTRSSPRPTPPPTRLAPRGVGPRVGPRFEFADATVQPTTHLRPEARGRPPSSIGRGGDETDGTSGCPSSSRVSRPRRVSAPSSPDAAPRRSRRGVRDRGVTSPRRGLECSRFPPRARRGLRRGRRDGASRASRSRLRRMGEARTGSRVRGEHLHAAVLGSLIEGGFEDAARPILEQKTRVAVAILLPRGVGLLRGERGGGRAHEEEVDSGSGF